MKRIPTFLAGMLTAAVIGGLGVGALAASGQLTITVDPINIQVNGETFQPKDAQGNAVPVFAYNGTTYAPLRALAEAYGLEVGYDAGAKMATVQDPGESPIPITPPVESAQNVGITHIKVGDKIYQYSVNSSDADELQVTMPMFIVGSSSELYFNLSAKEGYTDTVSLIGLTDDSVVLPSNNPYLDGLYCCRAIYSDKFKGLSWSTQKSYVNATSSTEIVTLTYNGHSITSKQFSSVPTSGTITVDNIRFVDGRANANDFLAYMGINALVSYEYDANNAVHIMRIDKH